MTEEVVYTCYTTGYVNSSGELELFRDSYLKIREYKTIDSAKKNYSWYGDPVVLKVTVTRV